MFLAIYQTRVIVSASDIQIAYSAKAKITVVKRFTVQALGFLVACAIKLFFVLLHLSNFFKQGLTLSNSSSTIAVSYLGRPQLLDQWPVL